ncbi:MAG: hypothetical protein HW419_152 [Deltaproteobacteria bacterium]|nr:hypothetical protein [Deltaproteobacteria bacterium]
MIFQSYRALAGVIAIALLSSCATTGVNPTGLTGGQVMCPSGPRPALDCRGVLQQYARDLKADLNLMSKVQIGIGLTTTKLTEADALTSDLLQHSYQTCTLYNACILPAEEYAARQERLQNVQLEVRRALVSGGLGFGQQQNIQINPNPGQPFPPQFPGAAGPPLGFPQGGTAPGFPQPGPGAGFPPQGGAGFPFGDPNFPPQAGFPQPQQFPGPPTVGQAPTSLPGANPVFSAKIPNPAGGQTGDAILNILRDGSNAFRGPSKSPASSAKTKPAAKQPAQDLDATLRGMVQSLRQDVAKKSPALASGRAVVGNFTEENRPWGSPLGAILQDRLSTIVLNDGQFKQATSVPMRGITIQEVAKVGNANDPRALTSLYDADLAISGTYQPQGDSVLVKLVAHQSGGVIAQTSRTVSASSFPDVVSATPQNAAETGQLLDSLGQIGPRADGRINITTSRPGAGSSYRLGEEITFLVSSNTDGYLYLFHTDAERNVTRIYPNQFQPQAIIRSGQTLQVPAPGANFKFEASPPFGLETTFAIVTTTPLSDADLQSIQNGFTGPKQEVPAVLKLRGIAVAPSGAVAAVPPVQWNSVTVLVRP